MIIFLQSVALQFSSLFWHMLYCKVRQGNFITKCGRLLLQSASGITKCEKFKNKEPQQKNLVHIA